MMNRTAEGGGGAGGCERRRVRKKTSLEVTCETCDLFVYPGPRGRGAGGGGMGEEE